MDYLTLSKEELVAELLRLQRECLFLNDKLKAGEAHQAPHTNDRAEENEANLNEAQRIAKMGNWTLDFRSARLSWSKQCYSLFNIREDVISENLMKAFRDKVNPFDIIAVSKVIIESARLKKGFDYQCRTRIDGIDKVFHVIAEPTIHSDDEVIGFKGTLQDITELKKIEEELIRAKERAEESDRLKTAFLQNISHEIRTPMNAIMGFSDLLADQYNNRSKLEYCARIINQRCYDLLDIIGEIIDIAKIDAGQVPIEMDNCKINSLFSELSTYFLSYQKRIDKQHLKFSLQLHAGSPDFTIYTDKIKLKQIFVNLICNAFKFTNEGEITAGCKFDKSNQLYFYVSDTGIGIPDDKQEYIFQRFAQVEQPTNFLYGGTGLGLSIVKGLIDLLGGKIWIESEPGRGATFYFSLPYQLISGGDAKELPDETGVYNFSGKTILLVEDDNHTAEYLRESLDGTGIHIVHTQFGKEAVILSESQHPDLVLMDIRLPDIDGYMATRLIKELMPEIKIIAQTAFTANESKDKAMEAGCNEYLSKPVDLETLLSAIGKQLFSNYISPN